MRKIKVVFAMALALMLVSGCGKDDEGTGGSSKQVETKTNDTKETKSLRDNYTDVISKFSIGENYKLTANIGSGTLTSYVTNGGSYFVVENESNKGELALLGEVAYLRLKKDGGTTFIKANRTDSIETDGLILSDTFRTSLFSIDTVLGTETISSQRYDKFMLASSASPFGGMKCDEIDIWLNHDTFEFNKMYISGSNGATIITCTIEPLVSIPDLDIANDSSVKEVTQDELVSDIPKFRGILYIDSGTALDTGTVDSAIIDGETVATKEPEATEKPSDDSEFGYDPDVVDEMIDSGSTDTAIDKSKKDSESENPTPTPEAE